MPVAVKDFHDAHAGLREGSELLVEAARALPGVGLEEREALRSRATTFLQDTVVPHTKLDEHVLYPEVANRLGDPLATATMSYDHVAIRGLIDDLVCADIDDLDRLQQLLYGLFALIGVHIWKEERLYLAMLESPGWPAQ